MTLSHPVVRTKPWRRATALLLSALIVCTPVSARGPGRAGIDALVDAPDELAPARANLPANRAPTSEATLGLPGNPFVSGTEFDTAGRLDITVSQDAVAGAPDGMALGTPQYSASGEMVVPLLGVSSSASVNGRPAVPAVLANFGRIDLIPPLAALKTVQIPSVLGLDAFVRDRKAAIALGKALFWEAKGGSDGLACASCHFAAGADNRMKNQLSPGLLAGDQVFNRNASRSMSTALARDDEGFRRPRELKATATGSGGPNYTLKEADFPFHRLADPLDRNSATLFSSNDVVSSQGTFAGEFSSLAAGGIEKCAPRGLDEFNVGGVLTRRVEPRNSPTVINAVFNHRNFWDGRANNVFNGVNPFGDRDPDARVLDLLGNRTVVPVRVALPNASLASQAVGPALSDFEMSCSGKNLKDLGRKLLPLRGLSGQTVHAEDSVLGTIAAKGGKGLKQAYADMVKQAFHPRWWNGAGKYDGYTHMESNFSLFWGLAIMMYESTLVSDDAPIDRFVGWAGMPPDLKALGEMELRGLKLFRGKALCVSCHRGAELTSAATGLQRSDETNLTEHMFVGGGQLGLYDNGYYNIGVRPTAEDVGVGAQDPFGNPLSFSRQFLDVLRGKDAPDSFLVRPCLFGVRTDAKECWTAPDPERSRTGVDGAFKTPTLRNVALTRPYFHNGSRLTLEQVVEFYNRGGDRRGPNGNDTTGYTSPKAPGGGASNIHPNIRPLNLSKQEQADLVAFLRNALTDRRVACEQAPFDHPSLQLTNGHAGTAGKVLSGSVQGLAKDEFRTLPAVGAKGQASGKCLPNDDGSPVRPATGVAANSP